MTDFRADLHCHTTCSDGTMTPKELVAHAKALGLSGLCITDHDTINAYKEAILAAKEAGILLGTGIEFSTVEKGTSIHVLGYDIDLESQQLNALCQKHIQRRHERNQRILDKLAKRGMKVEFKELQGHTMGRPHIAQALVDSGYVASIQEAFHKWVGDGKPCFDPGVPISTDETLEVIHAAGGKAFIAHPHLMPGYPYHELLKKPFDGIECYYSKCMPDQERKWVKLARTKGLLMSGGSDFHGTIKPGIPLGCSWVGREAFDAIFEKHRI
ncbi:MAG: PHP domain-containing protein [Verrucomicrobia bacterium]|nr:PHP domain-containing protein [Verrucomicrobiota bacterium]